MDQLRQEINNKEWTKVKPDWEPQTIDVQDRMGGFMDRYYADQAAQRAHELALAEANKPAPVAESPWETFAPYQDTQWRDEYMMQDYSGMD